VQALEQPDTSKLVNGSQPNMFELLEYCLKDENNDVRQSSYALLGDCAVHIFTQLQPYLPPMLDILLEQLDMNRVQYDGEETNFSVVNNACWSVGEIAMRQREGMQPYAERLLQKLYLILINTKTVPDSLSENAAIALGRLGFGCAQAVAPHLPQLAPLFLGAICRVDWTDEKAHALLGFVQIVLCNPEAMIGDSLLMLFIEFAKAPRTFWRHGESADGLDPREWTERQMAFKQVHMLLPISFDCNANGF
jgi:hypothetical protein